MKLGLKLSIGFLITIVLLVIIVVYSIISLSSLNGNVDNLANDKYPKAVWAFNIKLAISDVAISVRNIMLSDDAKVIEKNYEKMNMQKIFVYSLVDSLTRTIKTEEGKAILKKFVDERKNYLDVRDKMFALYKSNNIVEARRMLANEFQIAQESYFNGVQELINLLDRLFDEAAANGAATYKSAQMIQIILAILSLIIAISTALFITKMITKPLSQAVNAANNIADGKLNVDLETKSKDETAQLLGAMKIMANNITNLVKELNEVSHAASEGKLDKRANESNFKGEYKNIMSGFNNTLDAVIGPLNVTAEYVDRISKGDIPPKITDAYKGDFNEIKNNLNQCIDAVSLLVSDTKMLAKAAEEGKLDSRADAMKHSGDFRAVVNGVNKTLDNVIGPLNVAAEYVDRISKGDVPPKITDVYKGDFNEIKNNLNQCIDAVSLLVSDTKMLAKAAEEGKLDSRADAMKHSGDFRAVVNGVNKTLDNVIGPLNVAAEYVDRISKGDVPPKITEVYKGDFNEIKNNLNFLIDSLNDVTNIAVSISKGNLNNTIKLRSSNDDLMIAMQTMTNAINLLVTDAALLTKSAEEGKLDIRADKNKHSGDFRGIIDGVNKTLDNVIGPLNNAAEYIDRISKGDIPAKITEKYNGDFNEIKNNLNQCIDTVSMIIKGVVRVSGNITNGKLDDRGNSSLFTGDWAKLVMGINEIVDLLVKPINLSAEYIDRISKGDIPAKITEEYKGDFNEIKNNINVLIDSTNNVTYIANEISKGNLNNTITLRSSNDTLMTAMQTMTDSINLLINDANNLANLATSGRLESRVDISRHGGGYKMIVDGFNRTLDALANTMNVTANIMIADNDGNITFMNDSVKRLFADNERSIRKTFPNFDAKNIIGKNFDDFHKNPSNNRNILRNLIGVHKTQITLGDDIFKLFAQKLVDSTGKQLGYMVEWFFFTDQARFEKGLTSIIEDMTTGRFVKRMNIDELSGNYQEIAYSINSMLDAILLPVQEGNRVLSKISGGDLSETFDMVLQGDHKLMQNAVNSVQSWLRGLINYVTKIANGDMTADINKASDKDQIHQWLILMRDNIKDLISETKILAQSALEGKLSKRADEMRHQGDFRVIVGLINKMMDIIVEPVNESITVLQAVAAGDMTVNMVGDYKGDILKLKTALNDTVTSIHDILSQVKTTVEEVNSGSLQVSDASTSLSQGATEQAASLEEITSSMAEIGSQTKMNAENANHANILTNEAKVVADKGTKEMDQLNKAMKEINDSSKNISKIIKVIDEIAFQTNLLALNAAVEAARAGRHGKGFAVVAEEVRNLAARSATAAKETSDMIENSIKTVENGASLANRTSDALTEIKQSSIKAADIVAEIATSSNEQAQAIAQINEGLLQIDKVTQTNTASAEESASASEQLSGQANQLKNMISRFVLKDEYGYSNKMSKESSQRYISTRREASKRLSSHNSQENIHKNIRPEEIIKLDEDDFGRY